MRIPTLLVLAITWLHAAPIAVAQEDPLPLAPDGRPGLGIEGDARSYGRFLRAPPAAESAFLRGLEALEPEIRVLAEMVRRGYRERGYFRLLGRLEDQRLSELHRRFGETELVALDLLVEGGEVAEAFAEMFLDLRFRARIDLLDSFELEMREVEVGLALLRATQHGFVELKSTEARAIAERVDLSASMLRAIRLDLEALRERGDARAPGTPDPAWMAELIGLTKIRDKELQRIAFLDLQRKVTHRLERLQGALFTPRLRKKLGTELARRAAGTEAAKKRAEKARLYLLISPEGDDPPREVLQMAKHRRHQYALSEALGGLAHDPLDEELTYWTGITTDYLYRNVDSRQWFDRYLAMRGIRVDQHSTIEGRQLTEWEEHAREVVLRMYTPGGLTGK